MADGPVAYWRFNDAPPTAVNSGSLGAAANGTYNGNAAPGSQAPLPPAFIGFEPNNTAAQFDGTGDFVGTVGNLMNSKPVFTVSGWMRRNGTQNSRTGLWGQNDIVEFGYIANQTLEVWTDNGLDIANAIPDGEWAHLAIVSDGNPGTMFMYTNGVLAGQRAHSLPADNAFQFNIGGGGVFDDGVANGNYFNGQIDEVAIFNTALSASQIAAQYAGAFTPVTPLPNVAQLGRNKIGSVSNTSVGDFTIVGGGNDIWDNVDEFTYAYTEVTGDFDVQVRVESLEPSARWAKAGIMVRENLAEDSRMIFPRVTPPDVPTGNGGNGANDTRLAYRTGRPESTGAFGDDHNGGRHEDIDAANTIQSSNLASSNGWLRLVRRGNLFHMSNSVDGIAWQFVGTQDTAAGDWAFGTNNPGPFAKTVLLGLGVSRHSGSNTSTAQFRDFALTFGNPGSFNVIEAGTRGNPNGVRVGFDSPPGAGAGTAANYTLGVVSGPNVTVVTGVRFTTGNDAPERDPMTYTLEGTDGDPLAGGWTLIASGSTGFETDPGRNITGAAINFANTTPYRHYRLLFPTVRNASANSMQIAEIELLDSGGNDVTAPGDAILGVVAVAGQPFSAVAVVGTAAGANNYPAAEPPADAINNVTSGAGEKYLNFAEVNTGLIISPSGGALPADPTVTAAAQGLNLNTVDLTTTRLVEGATYILTVANIVGADGTPLGNAAVQFTHGAGYEVRRIRLARNMGWGADIAPYLESEAYARDIGNYAQDLPAVQSHTLFEDNTPVTGDGQEENYSMRISGLYVAPVTGNYTFYMSSDDNGRLYLSSDANPANKVEIAREPAWNGGREYINGANQASRGTPPANISVAIPLVAGGIYYLEEIHSEGGGGNFGSATVQIPGGPAVANGTLPIGEAAMNPSRQFGGFVFSTLGPVLITRQPTNTTATALTPATFRVVVDGTPGYRFQWRRNGVPIPGANGQNYTIPATQLTDDGARYSVVIANEFSSATSADAVLTVLNPQPPHLLGASSDASFNTVVVRFDNRVQADSSTNLANYSITNAAGTVIPIASATRSADARSVTLRTAMQLAEDATYVVTVADVRDETGTTILEPTPTNAVFMTLAVVNGYALKQYYQNWTGGATSVDAFIAAQRAGLPPTSQCLTPLLEQNTFDEFENYGGRIAGFYVATVDGPHTFYFASDDYGRFFLSTDATPANLREVAREPIWSGRRTWTGEAGGGGRVGVPSASGGPQANITGPIDMVAGQKYYFEAFFTEGGGGDNMGVAVQMPGGTAPANNDPPISGANLAALIQAGTLTITTQPVDQSSFANGFATFTVVASSTSAVGFCGSTALLYQWERSTDTTGTTFTNIPGATAASYVAGPLDLADDGLLYRVVVSAPLRTVTSSNARLGVVVDNDPPELLSAKTDLTFNTIRLFFSEIMDVNRTVDPGNFPLKDSAQNDIIVTSTEHLINAGQSVVVLHLGSPLAIDGVYQLEVAYQEDLAGNPTVKVGNPQLDLANGIVTTVYAFVRTTGAVLKELYLDLGGGVALADLRNSPKFPNSPDIVRYGNLLELNTFDEFENYGARLRGWLIPPVTGNYTFYMASDDNGEFWLSTDAEPANMANIAKEPVWSGRRTWTGEAGGGGRLAAPSPSGAPANIATNVSLVAGQYYYFEALVKEGGGGDNLGVTWQLPGAPVPANTSIPIEGQYIASLAEFVPPSATLQIQKSGGQVTISWSGPLCLQEADDVTGPFGPSTRANGVPFTPPTTGNKFYRLATCPP